MSVRKKRTSGPRGIQRDWEAVRVLASFDAHDKNADEDELTLERFRQLGVPTELTDNIDDSYEFIGPDGSLEGGGTPPRSARERVQRCLGWLQQSSQQAAAAGQARSAGRSKGKAAAAEKRNAVAVAFVDEHFKGWRQGKLTRALLDQMWSSLKRGHHVITSVDALEKILRRAKQR